MYINHNALQKEIKEKKLIKGKFDACITSYEILIKEKSALNKFNWYYTIIDEAHRIKNEKSVLSQCVRLFKSQNRLLLTGTPLQNNLHELWALLNFLLPEVFDSAEDFDAWFNLKEGQAQSDIVEQLHKVLKPFMLRRLKADVERGIPPKKEIYVECGMTDMQQTWYKNILTKNVVSLKGGEKMKLLNIVMQLRKCSNHPYLFDGAEPGPPYSTGEHLVENSGKMLMLNKLLQRLQKQQSRVLIFSQMTRMLDILEDFCFLRGFEYCRIDGQTTTEDRESSVEAFNKEGSTKFIFLLSTRAGGLGINLATADTVILYDSDWNPQADLQAQDRAHRIGQKKPVSVFRFVTKSTIEEKIYQRAVKKLYLDAVVIQQGRLVEQEKKMSKAELLAMIKFGAEEIFRAAGASVSDEDIDAILARGEEKAKELDKSMKESCQNNLLNFSLTEDANLYEWEGLDYSQKPTTSLILDTVVDTSEEKLLEELGECSKAVDEIIVSQERQSALIYFTAKNASLKGLEILNAKGYKVKYCRKNDEFIKQLEKSINEEVLRKGGERARRSKIEGPIGKEPKPMGVYEDLYRSILGDKRATGPKAPKYYDFQFLNVSRLIELWAKERDAEAEKEPKEEAEFQPVVFPAMAQQQQQQPDSKVEQSATDAPVAAAQPVDPTPKPTAQPLTEDEKNEREALLKEGFPEWGKKDFLNFIKGCETYGRANIEKVASKVEGLTVEEVKRYADVFFAKYKEVNDWEKYMKRIEKGEGLIQKIDLNNQMLQWKTKLYKNPWAELRFNYGQNKGKQYNVEEDRFLVCMAAQIGYGQNPLDWETIRSEIRRAWEFRFDWFFKSRTATELQRRCDTLVRLIEKEYNEEQKKLGNAPQKQATPANKRKGPQPKQQDKQQGAPAAKKLRRK